jgi:hypothetical protein
MLKTDILKIEAIECLQKVTVLIPSDGNTPFDDTESRLLII